MSVSDDAPISAAHLASVLEVIAAQRGIDFRGHRPGALSRRLYQRMVALGLTAAEYLALLGRDGREVDRLCEALTIKVSRFFRGSVAFALLEERVVPELAARAQARADRTVRVWSAGCAAGEEAYSLAILFLEHRLREAKRAGPAPAVEIVGTDVDPRALERARRGRYERESVGEVRLDWLERHFERDQGGYTLSEEVRRMVSFSAHDLIAGPSRAPASGIVAELDLILCRNVLIYLEREAQAQVLEKLVSVLLPGGYLLLADVETPAPSVEWQLRAVDERAKLYRRV